MSNNPSTGITLTDVRDEAFKTIQALRAKQIEVKDAQTIKDLLNTVIDTAKVQVEFLKAIPNSAKEKLSKDEIKAIAGTLKDRDAEMDLTMQEIEKNNKKPINLK